MELLFVELIAVSYLDNNENIQIYNFETASRSYNYRKSQDVLDKLYGNVGTMIKRLQSLEGDLQCQGVHTALEEFVPAICISFVEGFFIIGVAFLCFCFALTAILCAAPKTWKRFTSKK